MIKKLLITLIATAFISILTIVVFAAGNGTVDFKPEPSPYSTIEVQFTHDTLQGSLNSTAIVVWNSDGTALTNQWIASSTDNVLGHYFFSDGTKTLSTIGPYALPVGTYKGAAISLSNGCCSDAQMQTLWTNETNTNTNSAGYYYTDVFEITAETAPTVAPLMKIFWWW